MGGIGWQQFRKPYQLALPGRLAGRRSHAPSLGIVVSEIRQKQSWVGRRKEGRALMGGGVGGGEKARREGWWLEAQRGGEGKEGRKGGKAEE